LFRLADDERAGWSGMALLHCDFFITVTRSELTHAITSSPHDAYLAWCLARPGVSHFIDVDGHRAHYLEWTGPQGAPTLLLVHGFMGHAHWWDFVAPALAENYRVLALDLSGMGDSDHRAEYSLDHYVSEIAGVIRATSSQPVYLIGHSFGGRCSILTAYAHPDLLKRLVVVDSNVSFPDPNRKRHFHREPGREKKRYAGLASAKVRFKLMPEESGTDPTILEHVATHSIKSEGDAFVWKFDANVTNSGPKPAVSDARAIPLLKVPMDFVCGQLSRVVSPEHAQQVAAAIVDGRAPIVIPAGFHHLPIGEPVALVGVLRALLAV
jgi:pimeloyl-ACP methyl ester carboxylesterase